MTHVHKMPYDWIDEKLPAFHILVVQITIPCINQHKGRLVTQAITYPRLKLVIFGISVMMLKALELSSTIHVIRILFICYFTKKAKDGNI